MSCKAASADLTGTSGFLLSSLCTAEHNTESLPHFPQLSWPQRLILTPDALLQVQKLEICCLDSRSSLTTLCAPSHSSTQAVVSRRLENILNLWNRKKALKPESSSFSRDTQCWQKYTPEKLNAAFFGFLAQFLSCISKWKMSTGNSWQ